MHYLQSENPPQKYKTAQLIKIMGDAEEIQESDINRYFAIVEKINLIFVRLLEGTEIECEIK